MSPLQDTTHTVGPPRDLAPLAAHLCPNKAAHQGPSDLRAFTNRLYSSETYSSEPRLYAAVVLCSWVHLNGPSSDQKLFQCPFVCAIQSDLHLIPAADGL